MGVLLSESKVFKTIRERKKRKQKKDSKTESQSNMCYYIITPNIRHRIYIDL